MDANKNPSMVTTNSLLMGQKKHLEVGNNYIHLPVVVPYISKI